MDVNRSSESINMDEVDRAMSSAYSMVVNGLSQLYHLSQSQQMLAFQAGERHSLEKVRRWILGRWGGGYRPTVAEIDIYIQHELDFDGVNSTRITTQDQQTRMSASMLMASPVTPVQCGAQRNSNPMFATAPSRFSRGEQQPSLIQPGRYCHGDGSWSHRESNGETIEPHITQPCNSETQRQDWAMDLNVYDPQFNC
ncbi:uncharacterized protein LOC103722457 isoform X2 [Phoenix dactylifera]|uniref:Uncharacterized protein LOC103722457 isoform X2 n=1 Tax=Phoenix dactylifera TaxID=42345 RepID=A0A8B9ALX1_PHODC|nr:uncharacterized protein LOC103722457 isoform X2 [Phoenix dactylifera]